MSLPVAPPALRWRAIVQAATFLLLSGGGTSWASETAGAGVPLPDALPWLALGASVAALVVALIARGRQMHRLRSLATAITDFRRDRSVVPLHLPVASADDEIDHIARALCEMSERMAQQLQQLAQVDVRRRELLANVSHDLRTPLASMQGYLETLLLRQGALPVEEERIYLEVAAKHAERLGKLVDDLFQLTKFDANEVRLDAEPFSLPELVQDVVQKFQLAGERKGLHLEAVLHENTPPVIADIGMIERVLENLIENAMRHTPSGGVVRVFVEAADDGARLRVTDTGNGIAGKDLPHVFDRYYRGNRGENVDVGNVGLGLAITQRIAALHGSVIQIDSSLGKGTTFAFTLPWAS